VIVEASTPTRIDLAGGTIDIWPLYLFHENAQTVNFAIDRYATCRIETRDDGRIVLQSRDRGIRVEAYSVDELSGDDELELLSKLVYFFKPQSGLTITADCMAPAGAGLGGSSALNIAVCGAFNRMLGDKYADEQLLHIAANVETQVIKVPAGMQDYYPPLYGGVASIHLKTERLEREEIRVDIDELESRVVLCYTGKPRHSGTNNWEIFKKHIDGDREIFKLFDNIRDTAARMRAALVAGDFDNLGAILAEEWENRKRLSATVSTPRIDELIEIARSNGAVGAKVCGAGGGGCVTFITEKGRKEEVEKSLLRAGADVIEFKIDRVGLRVREVAGF